MRYWAPGLTVASHAAIKHTSTMIEDETIIDADVSPIAAIAYSKLNLSNAITLADLVADAKRWSELNRVKLPSPSVSDYVTPSAVAASSEASVGILEDFEADPPTGWTYSEVDTNALIYNERTTLFVKRGSYGHRIVAGTGTAANDYGRLSKDFDFTGRNTLKIWVNLGDPSALHTAYLRIGGVVKWSQSGSLADTKVTIDVSGITGVQTLDLELKNTSGATSTDGSVFYFDYLGIDYGGPVDLSMDDDTGTAWRPSPANEVGAWCRWDTGALKILGGCRLYWGTDVAYRPTSYKLQVSEDGATWIDVYDSAGVAPDAGWKEYTWPARYGRYIRYYNTHPTGENQEIYEMDYYSRLIDRVASEHAHGSSIEPHLKGSNVRAFEELRKAAVTLENLAKRLEILENLTL